MSLWTRRPECGQPGTEWNHARDPPVLSSNAVAGRGKPGTSVLAEPRPWALTRRSGMESTVVAKQRAGDARCDIRINPRSALSAFGRWARRAATWYQQEHRDGAVPDTVVKSLGAVFTWRRVRARSPGLHDTVSTQMFSTTLTAEFVTPFLPEERLEHDDRSAAHCQRQPVRKWLRNYGVRTLLLGRLPDAEFSTFPNRLSSTADQRGGGVSRSATTMDRQDDRQSALRCCTLTRVGIPLVVLGMRFMPDNSDGYSTGLRPMVIDPSDQTRSSNAAAGAAPQPARPPYYVGSQCHLRHAPPSTDLRDQTGHYQAAIRNQLASVSGSYFMAMCSGVSVISPEPP